MCVGGAGLDVSKARGAVQRLTNAPVLRVLVAVLEEADGSKQSLAQDTADIDSAGICYHCS